MKAAQNIRLTDLGICCALGADKGSVCARVLAGDTSGMQPTTEFLFDGQATVVGRVHAELPALDIYQPAERTRNNQLALHCLLQIEPTLRRVIEQYGTQRIAVVIGTSTSGIAEGENALRECSEDGSLPSWYDYHMQEMGAVASFVQQAAGVEGVAFAISTACSSSAQALLSARNLIDSGLADAVITGGVDSLCGLTLNGFHSLESLAAEQCLPFSSNRCGINIGEGGALFVMERAGTKCTNDGIYLLGGGSAADAYHMSAPHPEGRGALQAMRMACAEAGIDPAELGYINLHGTATPLNDAMESKAVSALGGAKVPAGSTKAMTGHTLGAAGAIEAALCWLLLSDWNRYNQLPPHIWDGNADPELTPLYLVRPDERLERPYCLSNSFAFGGSNLAVLLGRKY